MGYGSESSAEVLDHLASLGVDWVSITPFGFMESTRENAVRGEHNGEFPASAESRWRIERVVPQAKKRGLKVMLKPHIWIRGGKWRGAIKPLDADGKLDWDGWWDSHDEWILHYARMAAELEIDALVIGLELHTAVQAHPERLVALASKVRAVYSGHITYAANWNEPVPRSVWKALDSVGVQFYPPLAKERGTFEEAEIRATLRRHLRAWGEVADAVDRPLVITEVGYRSADIAVSHPNAWPEKMKGKHDEARQAEAYRLFFEELAGTPRAQGVFLWKYFTNPKTDEEGPTGFSPFGKPAEVVIERAFDAAR